MKIEFFNGDVLKSGAEVIAHQINCSGGFGSGMAGAIKKQYPEIADMYYKAYNETEFTMLGNCYIWETNDKSIKFANLCAQSNYGYDGRQYTSYDALWSSLTKLVEYCSKNAIKEIAFPYGMSSVRGGAKWEIVLQMIKSAFEDVGINIQIWKL